MQAWFNNLTYGCGILIQNRNLLLCLIILIVWLTLTLDFWYTKKHSHFLWGWRLIFFDPMLSCICNKIIEINFCLWCMVRTWLRLFQHWAFVKYGCDWFHTNSGLFPSKFRTQTTNVQKTFPNLVAEFAPFYPFCN